MDCAVDAAAAEEHVVGCVDDGVDAQFCNVGADD